LVKQDRGLVKGDDVVMFRQKHGFTLIELLVVISIIALLMSIMMPALGRVKEEARSVVCRSNLRQWGFVWEMAINDNDGRFIDGNEYLDMHGRGITIIPSGQGASDGSGTPMRVGGSSLRISDGAPYQTGVWDEDHSWPVCLWPYYRDRKLLCCAAAKKEPPGGDAVGRYYEKRGSNSAWSLWLDYPNDYIYGSYGINTWVFNRGNHNGVPYWRRIRQKRADLIPIMMDCYWCEGFPYHYEPPPPYRDGYLADSGVYLPRFCVDRHNGSTNGLFFDLSARRIGLKGLWRLKWNPYFDLNAPEPVWPDWMKKYNDRID